MEHEWDELMMVAMEIMARGRRKATELEEEGAGRCMSEKKEEESVAEEMKERSATAREGVGSDGVGKGEEESGRRAMPELEPKALDPQRCRTEGQSHTFGSIMAEEERNGVIGGSSLVEGTVGEPRVAGGGERVAGKRGGGEEDLGDLEINACLRRKALMDIKARVFGGLRTKPTDSTLTNPKPAQFQFPSQTGGEPSHTEPIQFQSQTLTETEPSQTVTLTGLTLTEPNSILNQTEPVQFPFQFQTGNLTQPNFHLNRTQIHFPRTEPVNFPIPCLNRNPFLQTGNPNSQFSQTGIQSQTGPQFPLTDFQFPQTGFLTQAQFDLLRTGRNPARTEFTLNRTRIPNRTEFLSRTNSKSIPIRSNPIWTKAHLNQTQFLTQPEFQSEPEPTRILNPTHTQNPWIPSRPDPEDEEESQGRQKKARLAERGLDSSGSRESPASVSTCFPLSLLGTSRNSITIFSRFLT